MKYDILTDTAFFRAAQDGNIDDMTASYGEFIEKVVDVCGCANGKTSVFATLLYTEIELKTVSNGNVMAEKALAFIDRMQKLVEQMPTASVSETGNFCESNQEQPMNWTGGIANLVELVYGLVEMGCVNDGKVTIEKLGNRLFSVFGLDPIPYSRTYTNIKRRTIQNGGRTYFLTEMRKMLDERIDQDVHLSLRR